MSAASVPLSKMAAAVQPSATLAAGAKARQLKAAGTHVFDFSLGEPDFPTPEHICRAAVRAMQDGHTHYTPAAGIPELRAAVARWYQQTYDLRAPPEQVLISGGAKHSIHNALAATVGPGPADRWETHGMLYLVDRLRCRSGHAELEIAAHPDGTGSLTLRRDRRPEDRWPDLRHSLFPEPVGAVAIPLPHGAVAALLDALFAPRFRPLRLLPIGRHRHPD